MPRLLFVSPRGSLDGGAPRSLIELLEALVADGRIDVELAVSEAGELGDRAIAAGIPVTRAPAVPWLSRHFRGVTPRDVARRIRFSIRIVRATREVSSLIRRVDPDVVVTNTLDSPVAALAAMRQRVPHIWWVREFGLLDSRKRYLLDEHTSLRIVDRTSVSVVAISGALAAHLGRTIAPAKISVIHPAIALETSPPLEPPVPGQALRLLLLGRVIPAKGHDLVLDALASSVLSRTNVLVRVVGDADEEYLKQLRVRQRALGLSELVEFVPRGDAVSEIDRAHVVLMCSTSEAFGRVTAEALERGRPVIAARSGGTTEMVRDGVNGLLFTSGSSGSLAHAIGRVAGDPELLRTLTRGAQDLGSGVNSTDEAVEAVINLVNCTHAFRSSRRRSGDG